MCACHLLQNDPGSTDADLAYQNALALRVLREHIQRNHSAVEYQVGLAYYDITCVASIDVTHSKQVLYNKWSERSMWITRMCVRRQQVLYMATFFCSCV